MGASASLSAKEPHRNQAFSSFQCLFLSAGLRIKNLLLFGLMISIITASLSVSITSRNLHQRLCRLFWTDPVIYHTFQRGLGRIIFAPGFYGSAAVTHYGIFSKKLRVSIDKIGQFQYPETVNC
jgi:hypothetical protein